MQNSSSSLFSNARFLKLWAGQGVSFVGDAISMVAVVVLVVQISGSASAVGGVLLARLLPTLASPLVGVLADRLDRRIILVTTDLARAALVLGLVFVEKLFVLYALIFLMGIAQTFFNPTIRAAFPSVVEGSDLARANALISGTFSISVAVGPALGGLLVAFMGVDAAFLLDAVTYLISAFFLARIPLPRPRVEVETSFLGDLQAGFAYLSKAHVPLLIIVGTFLVVLTSNATIPAEIFLAKDVFKAGDIGYGLLVGTWGGGMILGSVLIGVIGSRANLMLFYLLGIFAAALAFLGTGASPTFVLALGALLIGGAANGIDNVTTDTILQQRVPDDFLGRVFSVRFLTFSTGEIIAYPAGGLIVDSIGPRSTYLLAGTATVAVGTLVLIVFAIILKKER